MVFVEGAEAYHFLSLSGQADVLCHQVDDVGSLLDLSNYAAIKSTSHIAISKINN